MHKKGIRTLVWLLLALIGSQGIAQAQVDIDRVLTIGRNAIYFKDYVLAIQLLNNAIRTDSLRAEPYYYRAVAKYSLDDYRGAEEDATESITRNPYIYDAYYLRGIARHSIGKDSLAIQDYRAVLNNNPDHKGALHNSAVLYLAQKDTIEARRTLDYIQRYFPDYAMAYVIDGGLHLLQKDTVAAEGLFKKAMDLAPGMTGAYLSMAEIMYDRGDYPAAESYVDNALEHNSGEANLYINRALMRYKQNNFRGAMSDYSTAIQLEPNNMLARYNRALLRTQVGELNGALEDFNVVVQNDPDNYFATFNRAILSNLVGNPKLAVSDLDKIIQRYPTFVPAITERSNAYTLLGKESAARKDMYQASKLIYDERTANQAREIQDQQEALADDTTATNEVRDEKDENIRKFKLLVINSRDKAYNELYREEGESIRGRIQDRETAVELRPMYQLSYYTRSDSQLRLSPKSSYAEALRLTGEGRQISVTCDLPQLSEPQLQEHMSPSGTAFEQAMDYLTIKDHASVVQTLTEAIAEQPTMPALYFQRGVSRVLAFQVSQRDSEPDFILRKGVFEAAIGDFQKVLELVPDFAPALYNIGWIYYTLGQYQQAIVYFDRAIAVEGDMGVAYFNKGLTLYALGEKDRADRSMSRAGTLGIYDAYSIIRRMQ